MIFNNTAAVKKSLDKFKKEFDIEEKKAANEFVKQKANELYESLKDQFETMVIRSESKTQKPIVATIDTQLNFEQKEPDKPITHVFIDAKNAIERDAVITICHGTGMRIKQEVLNLVAAKTGSAIEEKDKKDLSDFYVDPSNADTKFVKRMEKAVSK
jgi:hypothetical protein